MNVDVAIVGGGPAGLAVGIEAALRGIHVAVFEKRSPPLDKACGEGLLPAGLAWLERRGVRELLSPHDAAPFTSVTYVQESGRRLVGRLPAPGGMGVRRPALVAAMVQRARTAGVELHEGCAVRSHRIERRGVFLDTDAGEIRARLLVAADGLHSPIRKAEGLALSTANIERFGMRRHVALAPWAPTVEVHFSRAAEAYVTPAGTHRVGIALLWQAKKVPAPVSFDSLLGHFPALRERLRTGAWESRVLGAGPLLQRVKTRVKDRLVLVGDAAGYVDALTGEGLALAFEEAAALGESLPRALAAGASAKALAAYEQRARAVFTRSALLALGLLWIARRPDLRRAVVDGLAHAPGILEWLIARATTPARGTR